MIPRSKGQGWFCRCSPATPLCPAENIMEFVSANPAGDSMENLWNWDRNVSKWHGIGCDVFGMENHFPRTESGEKEKGGWKTKHEVTCADRAQRMWQ